MRKLRFGCQFYTWQMSGDKYVGALPHICNVVRQAGFAGIESETLMLGSYFDSPTALQDVLAEHRLALGAIALVCDWQQPCETEEERALADKTCAFLANFPGAHLVLCQFPGTDRSDLRQRQDNCIACITAIARRAADCGLDTSFHPNSPSGSLFRTEQDYRLLLEAIADTPLGFCPDTGHMARGGMDVVAIFRQFFPLIRHVHFKDCDADGQWQSMGAGAIDFPLIVALLADANYAGWVMVEEESAFAECDPDAATLGNGQYVREVLLPLAAS